MVLLARFTPHRLSITGAGKIAFAVTAAASVTISPTARGDATESCPSGADGGRSALRAAGVAVRLPGAWGARISDNGRYVIFVSYADDLVIDDTNQRADVFRLDRETAKVLRVSLDTDGLQFHHHSAEGSISGDGDRVAFSAGSRVYMRDVGAVQTVLASVSGAGVAADDWSGAPVLSSDGHLIAFTSRATNLVMSDRDRGSIEAYLRDLKAGTTERVSIGADGPATPTWSWAEAVSDNGRYVAFTAGAAGRSPAAPDTYPGADVFLRDRRTQTTEVVSVAPDGRSMGGWFLGMSADGMRVLFGSGPQPDAKPSAFMRDRSTRTTRLVAPIVTSWRRSAGTGPSPLATIGQRHGRPAALSANGDFVAVQTALPTGPIDTNGTDDIVVVNLATDTSRPATRSSAGCPGNGASGEPAFSRDGSLIGFTSEADDLAGPDNDRQTNVYLRDMSLARTERISRTPPQ